MLKKKDEHMEKFGFAIVSDEDGMDSVAYTASCSGSRSDCCTRVCSADANFVENVEAWEQYLAVKGGQVQY
jgi:hypothetical protein